MTNGFRRAIANENMMRGMICGLTCARRVSDGVALATHMKLTVGSLLFMTYYLAELAVIRAVPGEMIVTASFKSVHFPPRFPGTRVPEIGAALDSHTRLPVDGAVHRGDSSS
jgi:hypothetical protein